MPANIHIRADGTAAAIYANQPAWHGLGEVVAGEVNGARILKAIGKWRIEKFPAYAKVGNRYVLAPDNIALVRSDTHQVYGFATPAYQPAQNAEVIDVMEAIVKTARRARKGKAVNFAAAAALGNGAKLFAVIDLRDMWDLSIPGDPSPQQPYLIATWSHDALEAIRIGYWNRRMECDNMRRMWQSSTERDPMQVRITHTGDLASKVQEAQRILGLAESSMRLHVKVMRDLMDIPVPSPEKRWIADFTEKLIPIPEDMERPASRQEARDMIADLYLHSKTLTKVPHSAYRVLQAVDEYADHYRPVRVKDANLVPERRFSLITQGAALDLKEQAFDLLREQFELVPVRAKAKAATA